VRIELQGKLEFSVGIENIALFKQFVAAISMMFRSVQNPFRGSQA